MTRDEMIAFMEGAPARQDRIVKRALVRLAQKDAVDAERDRIWRRIAGAADEGIHLAPADLLNIIFQKWEG